MSEKRIERIIARNRNRKLELTADRQWEFIVH